MSADTVTWAEVAKGDRVRMGGKVFTVKKAKRKGKKVEVVVEARGARFASTVKAKGEVEKVGDPLTDVRGAQRRWATRAEAEPALAAPTLQAGDPSVTAPPKKAKGATWDTSSDDAERAMRDALGAELIAEGDPDVGYYVPPVTLETVRAHLLIFHERQPFGSEVDALAEHDAEHRAAAANATLLPTNHWHSKRRPSGEKEA